MPAGSLRFIRPPTPALLAAEVILKAGCLQSIGLPELGAKRGCDCNESHDVDQDGSPECCAKLSLDRLVAQELLREECARPTTSDPKQVKRCLRRPPAARIGSRLVPPIGKEAEQASPKIDEGEISRHPPERRNHGVQQNECRYREQRGRAPLSRGITPRLERGSCHLNACYFRGALPTPRIELNLEGNKLAEYGSCAPGRKRLDVGKDILTARRGVMNPKPLSSFHRVSRPSMRMMGFEIPGLSICRVPVGAATRKRPAHPPRS